MPFDFNFAAAHVQLIAGAFTVYYVAAKAIMRGRIVRRELVEQERLQKVRDLSFRSGLDGF